MTILLIVIKLFLYLTAFGPMAVLFASVIGLACGLLTMCVRAISLASFTWLQVSARSAGPVPSSTDAKALLTEADVPSLHLEPR